MAGALIAVNPGVSITSSLYVSTFSNGTYTIDKTGTTDSWNAFVAAIAAVAGTNTELVVDCPVLLTIGTTYSRQIFLPSNFTMRFTGVGKIITDAVMVHVFNMQHATDVIFINFTLQYTGTFFALAGDQQNPSIANYGTISNANDVTTKAFLAAGGYNGTQFAANSFSGSGSSTFPSATNACALINLQGQCDRIYFLGKTRAYVAQGTAACNFIPVFISVYTQWIPGTLVTTAVQTTPPTPAVAVQPLHVYIEDLYLDGYLMGIVGCCRYLNINAIRGVRYSDLQDSNGNNVGGQVYNAFTLTQAPQSPYTSATLQTAWGYTGNTYQVTFSDGSTRQATFTNNSTTISWTGAVASGLSTTIQVTFSQYWFAPPHLYYVHSLDLVGSFPVTANVYNYFDEGVYVGTPNRRSINSGYLTSLKLEPANGSVFDGLTSLRPDGMMDLLTANGAFGTIKNAYCELYTPTTSTGQLVFTGALSAAVSGYLTAPWPYGSGTQTYTIIFSNGTSQTGTFVNGQTYVSWGSAVTASATATVINTSQSVSNFGVRFPSSPPMQDVSLDIEIVDTASVPTGFPFLGDGQPLNTGVNIKSRITVQDWPGVYIPGYAMGGTNINIDSTIIFLNCSGQTQYIGSAENTGSITVNESNYKLTLVGWRAAQIMFNAVSITLSSAPSYATSGTLAAGAWIFPNAILLVTFSDGSTRQVTFINGSSAISWTNPTAVGVSATIQVQFQTLTLAASPTTPFTSATLAAGNWPYGTTTYPVVFSDGSTRSVTFTLNSSTISWTGAVASGLGTTITLDAIAAGATSATLAKNFAYATGTYAFAFSDGEQRQVSCTNNSASVTWTGGLNNPVTNAAQLQFLTGSNIDQLKNRIVYTQGGLSYSNRLELSDCTNGYRALVEDFLFTEEYAQGCLLTPTGATYSTPIIFPNSFSITGYGYSVTTAFTVATGISIGDSNNATRFVSNGSVAVNTNSFTPAFSPIALVNSPTTILLTGVGGNLTSGTLYLSLKGVRYSMAG